MGIDQQDFSASLIEQSVYVDRRLSDCERMNTSWGETSITEDLLYRLGSRFENDLEVVPYNQREEATTGADWAWEWHFEGSTAWFSMLVQAKKLKRIAAGRFGYDIGYTSGSNGDLQIDVLREFASAQNMSAVYALYNGPNLDVETAWPCPTIPRSRPMMGVSVLSAEIARQRLEASDHDRYVLQSMTTPWSVPLSCVSRCDGWISCGGPFFGFPPAEAGFPPETPEYDLAYRVALSIKSSERRFSRAQFALAAPMRPSAGVSGELSDGVTRRIVMARDGEVDTDAPSGLAGAVVVRSAQ